MVPPSEFGISTFLPDCTGILVTDDIQIKSSQTDQFAWCANYAQVAYAEIRKDLRAESVATPFAGRIDIFQRSFPGQAVEQGFGLTGLAEHHNDAAILIGNAAQRGNDCQTQIITTQMQHI